MEWMLMPLKRYAEFSGRSRRKEYWMWVLFQLIVGIVLGFIEGALGLSGMIAGAYGPLTALFGLAVLVPGLAVGVRRLHDTDRSGWWLLIALVPLIGAIVLIVFFVTDGTRGANRFGPDPKDEGQAEAFA